MICFNNDENIRKLTEMKQIFLLLCKLKILTDQSKIIPSFEQKIKSKNFSIYAFLGILLNPFFYFSN